MSKDTKPTKEEILESKVYDYSWYAYYSYKNYKNRFDIIGKLDIEQDYIPGGVGTSYAAWHFLVSNNIDDYYRSEENYDIKNISKFLRIKANKIQRRQKQSVLQSLQSILKSK